MGNLMIGDVYPPNIQLGGSHVSKVMCGSEQVWPKDIPWGGGVAFTYKYVTQHISSTSEIAVEEHYWVPIGTLADAWKRWKTTRSDTTFVGFITSRENDYYNNQMKIFELTIAPRYYGDPNPQWVGDIVYDTALYVRCVFGGKVITGDQWSEWSIFWAYEGEEEEYNPTGDLLISRISAMHPDNQVYFITGHVTRGTDSFKEHVDIPTI